jgi:hypothetical protein
MRAAAALSVVGAVPALVGGLVFWGLHGGTTAGRSLAYGFWFAAAVLLVLMALAGNKRVWRRTSVTIPEGWEFVTAAVVLTAVGAAIDAIGG